MDVFVITHPTFENISEVNEAVRIINQQQKSFRLLLAEGEWVPEITQGKKGIDSNQIAKEKKRNLGNKPSIVITQRSLKGEFFSQYKTNFYLISTSAWEGALPKRPLHLYLAYLNANQELNRSRQQQTVSLP